MPLAEKAALATESDVEQKFLFPLLQNDLGFSNEEILTKQYLVPSDIDKGAGKKIGYYPDYAIYVAGVPILIVEAKDPETGSAAGYREARMYAAEVNKRFPSDCNPVRQILSSDGRTLIYGPWDSEAEAVSIDLDDLKAGRSSFETMIATLGRQSAKKHADMIRHKLLPTNKFRPLSLIGGPSKQSETLPSNSFSRDLIPLLHRYFDPESGASSDEIIRRAYVPSTEATRYNSDLDALLKDRLPRQKDVEPLETTRKHAGALDDALRRTISHRRDNPDPLIILVGGVGSGKSTFLRRYFSYLAPREVLDRSKIVTIDFNRASDSLDHVENWICTEFVAELKAQDGDSFLEYENLRRYFAPDLAQLERGPLRPLKDADPAECARRISANLEAWYSDPRRLASGIGRYLVKDCSLPLLVIFDNVDRRDRDQQLKIFQTVQWFRHFVTCMSILTLRDETFDAYRNQPPLDAFLKPFAFRIHAPHFVNVVKKRLELAIEYLTQHSDKRIRYELDSGVHIEYPATSLGRYLFAIYLSLFKPSRKIRLILEALAGRDVRRALEMFADILTSGHLDDKLIISITQGAKKELSERLIIRVLMRTSHRYYASAHGYTENVFATPEGSASANNFLLIELLEYLIRHRKSKLSFAIEGYHYVPDLIREGSRLGYTQEDVLWGLEVLLNKGLIVADHQRSKGINHEDYVRVTASGYFHTRFLLSRIEYFANAPIDAFLSDEPIARDISRNPDDRHPATQKRLDLAERYFEYTAAQCAAVFPAYEAAAAPTLVRDCIRRIREHALTGYDGEGHSGGGDLFDT